MKRIRRILFVSEAITLAQQVRLLALARSLPGQFEPHFASARFDRRLFGDARCKLWPIDSVRPAHIDRAVRWGMRLYSRACLERYVVDDLRLIAAVKPDLIVGDFRWSLTVSGPLSRVPVATLCNAWWSPFAVRDGFPLPEHPVVQLLGVERAARHFARAIPATFRWFARPLDRVRERHGLEPFGNLERLLTWGQLTLYADPPALVPTRALPSSHRFLGPVHWAPQDGADFGHLGRRRPLVYVTMGSSGDVKAVPIVLDALAHEDVDVLVATAARVTPNLPANAFALPFVRGDLAARRAELVICNGGASTAYQALTEGTPVLGLPRNLDQYLAMTAIENAGAGVLLRSGEATPANVAEAARRAVRLRRGAQRLAAQMRALDAPVEFLRAIESL